MFNERLKKLRKQNNITQEAVAKYLNIARPSYTRYETGEREPDLKTLKLLADYFNCSIDFLAERTDTPEFNINK